MDADLTPAQQPKPRTDLPWVIITGIVFAAVLAGWVWFTPAGFWGKLRALGYAVCHQLEERSFCIHGICSPLCARCTGMYLGALMALGFQAFQGRKAKAPPVWVIVVLVLFFAWFGVDGVNSFARMFPGFEGIYPSSNLFRLITGMGVGLGIGTVLFVVFNRTVWKDWVNASPFKGWFAFPALIAIAAAVIVLIQTNQPAVLYPVMILSGMAIFVVLSGVYTVVAVMLLGRENELLEWKQLILPILMGMTIALLQILVTSWLRLALTGTWESLHL